MNTESCSPNHYQKKKNTKPKIGKESHKASIFLQPLPRSMLKEDPMEYLQNSPATTIFIERFLRRVFH